MCVIFVMFLLDRYSSCEGMEFEVHAPPGKNKKVLGRAFQIGKLNEHFYFKPCALCVQLVGYTAKLPFCQSLCFTVTTSSLPGDDAVTVTLSLPPCLVTSCKVTVM